MIPRLFLLLGYLVLVSAVDPLDDSIDYLRGGQDLVIPVKWARQTLEKATIGPLVQPIATFIAKSIVIAFITAEIMAYLGFIGDRGEGLYEWAMDNEEMMHSWIKNWGMRPGGYVRHRLELMLQAYKNLPPKAKFASAVSTGTTAFPLVLKTSLWSGAITTIVYLCAEMLAFIGILGDPGEGLRSWVEEGDAEPLLHTMRRVTDKIRFVLRKKLHVQKLLTSFVDNIRNDTIFWWGFAVGGVASILIPIYYS